MGRACGMYGGQERCTPDFGGEFRRKERPLGKPRHRWEDCINMDLQEVRWAGDIDCIDLTQDRDRRRALVNVVMNLQVL